MLAILCLPFFFLVGAGVFCDMTGSASLGVLLFVLILVAACCGTSKGK